MARQLDPSEQPSFNRTPNTWIPSPDWFNGEAWELHQETDYPGMTFTQVRKVLYAMAREGGHRFRTRGSNRGPGTMLIQAIDNQGNPLRPDLP
jgi:hypothetical protein